MKKVSLWIMQMIMELISKKQILIIKKKFSQYVIGENCYDAYTRVFDGDIRNMKAECRDYVRSVQSHYFMDNENDGAEFIHEAFDGLQSRTKKDALIFRHNNLDQDGRSIYSTTMNWDFVMELSSGKYSDIQCIFVHKGARIIPTASVVRYDKNGVDSEYEIIVDTRYARRIRAHLWEILPS